MSGIVRDYLKCVYANKFTFAGYCFIGTGFGIAFCSRLVNPADHPHLNAAVEVAAVLTVFSGTLICNPTDFGRQTYGAYKRTRDHIKRFGDVDDRFKDRMDKTYCRHVGFELAVREAGLEGKL